MTGRYDRSPRREWEERGTRRSATQQIGLLRLIGFIAILAGSYLVLNRDHTPTAPLPPTSGAPPRVAIDAALAPILRGQLPAARLTIGTSDELAEQLRGGLVVDLAVLGTTQTASLGSTERCSEPQAIAERHGNRYAACLVNAEGSSRALASRALNALTGIDGRSALLTAGFDVPEVRPTTATSPATTTP